VEPPVLLASAPTPLVAPGLTPKTCVWPALMGRTPVLLRANALGVATTRKTAAAKSWMVAVVARWDFRMFSPVFGGLIVIRIVEGSGLTWLQSRCVILTAKQIEPRPPIDGYDSRKSSQNSMRSIQNGCDPRTSGEHRCEEALL